MRVALTALASLALVGCGASSPHVAHGGDAPSAPAPLAFRRVTLDPTGASFDMPGDGTSAHGMDSAPGRPTTLDVEQTVTVGDLRFVAGVHDFVAHEIPDPAALAGQFLQAASSQFQMTATRADTTLVQGAFAADATFESAAGLRLRMLVVVGRTRAYHPYVIGPRAAMDAHAAGVERFLRSLRFDADDVPWQPGDGALVDGGTWMTARPVGWRFSVDMPGPAMGFTVPSAIEGAEAMTISLSAPTRGFRVTAWHFAPGVHVPRDIVTKVEDDITHRLHGVIRNDTPALVRGTGARFLDVEFRGDEHLEAHELIVVMEDMVYEVAAFYPHDAMPEIRADAARFLASFHPSHP